LKAQLFYVRAKIHHFEELGRIESGILVDLVGHESKSLQ
jgi:hypothetical protein